MSEPPTLIQRLHAEIAELRDLLLRASYLQPPAQIVIHGDAALAAAVRAIQAGAQLRLPTELPPLVEDRNGTGLVAYESEPVLMYARDPEGWHVAWYYGLDTLLPDGTRRVVSAGWDTRDDRGITDLVGWRPLPPPPIAKETL